MEQLQDSDLLETTCLPNSVGAVMLSAAYCTGHDVIIHRMLSYVINVGLTMAADVVNLYFIV